MVRKFVILHVISIIFPLFSFANDKQLNFDYFYVSVHGHGSELKDSPLILDSIAVSNLDYENGIGFGASLGYHLPVDQIKARLEGEFLWLKNDVSLAPLASSFVTETGHYSARALMLNFLMDFDFNSVFSPYIGGGVGVSNLYTNYVDDNVFAYQFMFGLSANISDKHAIYGGYRYFEATDPSYRNLGQRAELDYQNQSIEIGYRMQLGNHDTTPRQSRKSSHQDQSEQVWKDEMISEQRIRQRNIEERKKHAHNLLEQQRKQGTLPSKYNVQAGIFLRKENAYKSRYMLSELADMQVKRSESEGKVLYQVVTATSYSSRDSALRMLDSIKRMGYADAVIHAE